MFSRKNASSTVGSDGSELPSDNSHKSLPPTPFRFGIRKATTINVVNGVMGTWADPVIQNSLQILEQVADVGKALPFVAPAFALLKIIVDIENKARDADTKCTDLLERINFMLGQLPALKLVQITDATRQVVERMNHSLKASTALIQAYRKQGTVSRRINVGNRDKFISCADSINKCTNDLMITLQIHQTSQLDIITRPVPVDPVDEAAKSFISSHGGVDAVKDDRELIAQFASTLHLTVDDRALEQINTNITDLMQQNQEQLERTISSSVGASVVDGFKEIAAKMTEVEKEQVFTCVQCDKEYRNSTNGPKSCSFHRAEYSSWNKSFPCCSGNASHPCEFSSHRPTHHCDYPYAAFFPRAQKVLKYVDTIEKWASIEDSDLEKNAVQKASAGRLLRWVSRGERIDTPTILITVGTVWFSEPYFFDTFTAAQLESVARDVFIGRKTSTIFRTSQSEDEFAMAEWVLSRKAIVIEGIRLTAKAATSSLPYVVVCPIDAPACTKSGDVVTVSEGGLRAYTPEAPYVLPETVRAGPELQDKSVRAPRTDFKTRTSAALPLILKPTSDPPLSANPQFARYDADNFEGSVSVFNKQPSTTPNPITIAKVTAFFRLVGDEEYSPVLSLRILDRVELPVTIDSRQSWALHFEAVVPRTEEDTALQARWFNRAFVARHRPLRLKLVLEDIEDEECSLVLEYVFTPFPFDKPKPDDLARFFFDDPQFYLRHEVRVTKASNGNQGVLRIDRTDIAVKTLQKIVYKALKTGETEINLDIGQKKDTSSWTAWALVDVSCKRVYAIKVVLTQADSVARKTLGCVGYVLCPDYGNTINATRPVRYAQEKAKLEVEPLEEAEFVTEDTVDDYVPEPPKPVVDPTPALPTAMSSTQAVVSDDLNQHLTSIDSSLSRLATAVEQLVDILKKNNL
ncbi:hypothetical protein SCP_1001150 [Sparassis crispa]|uniref:Uncharacterized protein n=1 Tax=Sparassis crispa TaxID=139825 RepID=A0A401GXF6_9APHY|nr:hypothetical protein SCP_1001150 [Sparassis crispa]GBE86873.1 hypothetical protein SCP_1001150 [Sparassis crispa]